MAKGSRNKIIISYRREDGADAAGRIYDWLIKEMRVPKELVFTDVAAILPGVKFMDAVEEAIGQCRAMIIVISPSWMPKVLSSPDAYVRIEAETAIRKKVLIIPILIGGTQPDFSQLPPSLSALKSINARQVRSSDFAYDMTYVARGLGLRSRSFLPLAATLFTLLLLLTITLTQIPAGNPIYGLFHNATPTTQPTTPITHASPTSTLTPSPTPTVLQQLQAIWTAKTSDAASHVYSFASNNDPSNAGWEVSNFSNKVCTFTDGSLYRILIPTYGGISNWCFGGANTTFGDFLFRVKTIINTGDGSGIVFRIYVQYARKDRFEIHTNGTYLYYIGTQSASGSSPYINKGLGAVNTIGTIAIGSTVGVVVNDHVIAVDTDTLNQIGTLGVGADAYSQNADVQFQSGQVWDCISGCTVNH